MGRISGLRRNLAYKLVSLALAGLLYGVAYTQQNPRTTRSIPVEPEVRALASGLALREPPGNLSVRVSGPASVVDPLDARSIGAVVDVSGARQPGTTRFPVSYSLPQGMSSEVQAVGPTTLVLTVERKVRRAFAIDVIYGDSPPAGTAFARPVTQPNRVSVVGREPIIGRIAQIVAHVDTTGAAGAISEDSELVALDARQQEVEGVEIQPARVRVRIDTRPLEATKSLVLSPVLTGDPVPGFAVSDCVFGPQTVIVSGPQQALANISSLDVPLEQDGLSRTIRRTVALKPPPGLKFVGDGKVRVTLVVKPVSGVAPAPP